MLKMKVYGALVLVQLFFGVHYFLTKMILDEMSPRAWASIRIAGAALLLVVWNALFIRKLPRSWKDVGWLCVLAVFGVIANQVLFVEGLARTTPSHSAIINSTIPVMTLMFAILLGREQATTRHWLSMALSFGSILVLLKVEEFRLQDELVVGDLLTLANACSFSFFLVISKNFLNRNHSLASTAHLMVIGFIGISAIGAGPLMEVDFSALSKNFYWMALYAIVCATALAYFLNYYALQHVDSSMVALFIYLQAPIAAILSVSFLHEQLTTRFFVAAAGIFLGVFLSVWKQGLRLSLGSKMRS